jgi:hypothetical protein
MAITDEDMTKAEARMAVLRDAGHVAAARYDHRTGRVVIELQTGVQLAVPSGRIEGLSDATPRDLAEIEISPAGLGLTWPRLDVDVYVPALLQGVFGSRQWMASQLGGLGGRARSSAKADAARENGRKGGRPSKTSAA